MGFVTAIYDRDTEYAGQLAEYMNRKIKKSLQIRVFTNGESLREYCEGGKIDLLLLGDAIPFEEIGNKNIGSICLLSESSFPLEAMEYPIIYKYQPARQIQEELFGYFPLMNQNTPSGAAESAVILTGILSMGRGAEQSALSLSLANRYSMQKKTLYVNLDVFQALPLGVNPGQRKGLSDFIYYLKQNNSNLMMKMKGLIQKTETFDYIPGVGFGPDLFELTAEDAALWIRELRKWGEYEAVVFEVGSIFEAGIRVLEECSQVWIVLGDNPWERERYLNLKEQFLFAGLAELLDKCRIIPVTRQEQEELQKILPKELFEEGGERIASAYLKESRALSMTEDVT